MEKTTDPKGATPEPVTSAPLPAPSRFQCLPVPPDAIHTDDEELEDEEDGFQCPCCLPR